MLATCYRLLSESTIVCTIHFSIVTNLFHLCQEELNLKGKKKTVEQQTAELLLTKRQVTEADDGSIVVSGGNDPGSSANSTVVEAHTIPSEKGTVVAMTPLEEIGAELLKKATEFACIHAWAVNNALAQTCVEVRCIEVSKSTESFPQIPHNITETLFSLCLTF